MDPLIIVGAMAAGSPVLLAWLTGRQRRSEQKADWERQDKVAAQAEEAARLLLAANERVARASGQANGKLDVIHTLVNSSLTSAMQSELDATVRELAMMNEVISLNRADGREPSAEALAAIKSTKEKIDELKLGLEDRTRQQDKVEQQEAAIRVKREQNSKPPEQPGTKGE